MNRISDYEDYLLTLDLTDLRRELVGFKESLEPGESKKFGYFILKLISQKLSPGSTKEPLLNKYDLQRYETQSYKLASGDN